jgi:hypothetical protein
VERAMVITTNARRFISDAVSLLSDSDRDRWREWTRQYGVVDPASEMPYEIAEIALRALVAAECDLKWRLQQPNLHEDARSDIVNDFGYIQAIQDSIRAENVGS